MVSKLLLALTLVGTACATAQAPIATPPPPVTTTAAVVSASPLEVTVVAPPRSPYRSEVLGSKVETVGIQVLNSTNEDRDLSPAHIWFRARRGAVPMRCDKPSELQERDPHTVSGRQSVTFLRDLCSLPLPGHYTIDVMASFHGEQEARVASFGFDVTAGERNVPRALASYPNLWAALGGNLTGVKFTKPEWKTGAYHVTLRVTNAASIEAPLGPATMLFHVYKDQHPLACTDTKPVALPEKLAPGESATASIPVTCLVDVQGMYQIHAALAFPRDEVETELAVIWVEVTSDPLIYLPVWPY